jgi:hypothetical protein
MYSVRRSPDVAQGGFRAHGPAITRPQARDPEQAQHGQRAEQLAVTELTVEPREDSQGSSSASLAP